MAAMRVHVGTSGWSYDGWKGPFYPGDIAGGDMLAWYAERLSSVEVNNTFYRMPKRDVLRAWAEQTPESFSFVLKASRRITHQSKLGEGSADPLAYLLGVSDELGEKRGPVFFQTPPWLKKDMSVLEGFLARLPHGVRAAFEFRSTSWFEEDVYELLRERGAALVAADTGDAAKDPPLVATAPWGYVRLRRESYDGDLLAEWARRVGDQPWEQAWVFFKHEEEGAGPALATRFRALMEE